MMWVMLGFNQDRQIIGDSRICGSFFVGYICDDPLDLSRAFTERLHGEVYQCGLPATCMVTAGADLLQSLEFCGTTYWMPTHRVIKPLRQFLRLMSYIKACQQAASSARTLILGLSGTQVLIPRINHINQMYPTKLKSQKKRSPKTQAYVFGKSFLGIHF